MSPGHVDGGKPGMVARRVVPIVSVFTLAILLAGSRFGSPLFGALRTSTSGLVLLTSPPIPSVLSPTFGGVEHYTLPVRFNRTLPSVGNGTTSGTLHLFLKAVRWPDGHLRMKGFVFFEFDTWPEHWRKTPALRQVPVRNIPEVFGALRLGLRATGPPPAGRWERELSLEAGLCGQYRNDKQGNNAAFERCVAEASTKFGDYYDYQDISVDFGTTESVEYDLFLYNTPRYIPLAGLLSRASAAELPGTEPAHPQVFKVIGPMRPGNDMDASQAAQRLAWQAEHHVSIGFSAVVMYAYPQHALQIASEPVLQPLLSSGSARLVSWDQMAMWEGINNFDLQIVLAHGVLSFWGRTAYVHAADMDEFIIPATPGDMIPAMLSGGCLSEGPECSILPGRAVFTAKSVPQAAEPYLWTQPGPIPLAQYQFSSPHGGMIKPLVDPARVFPVAIHQTSVCAGTGAVADNSTDGKVLSPCGQRRPCNEVPDSCAWIAHVINMHRARATPVNATSLSADWFWMAKQ